MTVILRGEGVEIAASKDVAERLLKSQALKLRVVPQDNNGCEPGGCGTCAGRRTCIWDPEFKG